MRRYFNGLFILGCSFFSLASLSATTQTKAPDAWAGTQASLGSTINTGNTKTTNFNMELDVNYAKTRWSNAFKSRVQYGSQNNTVNQKQYFIQEKVNYSCNDISTVNNSIYALGSWAYDYFGPFKEVYNGSVGYERDWFKTDKWQLSTSVGPTYTITTEQNGQVDRNINALIQSTLVWNVTATASLKQELSYQMGKLTKDLKSTSSVTANIASSLAVQVSYFVENWSPLPKGGTQKHSTNTITTVSLVYSF